MSESSALKPDPVPRVSLLLRGWQDRSPPNVQVIIPGAGEHVTLYGKNMKKLKKL